MFPLLVALLLQARWLVPPAGGVMLQGDWRFHPGDAPAYAGVAFDDRGWPLVPLGVAAGAPAAPLRGAGWYRGRFVLGQMPASQLGLEVRAAGVAFEVYVDSVRLGAAGRFPPEHRARSSIPFAFAIPLPYLTAGAHVVAIRAYSVEPGAPGFQSVAIAPLQQVLTDTRRRDAVMLAAALLFLGLALYQLFFWTRRVEAREHLYVFLFCVGLSLAFVVRMPSTRVALEPAVDWFRVYLALVAASGSALGGAVRGVFELEPESLGARAARVLGIAFGVVALLVLLVPGWGMVQWVERFLFDPGMVVGALALVGLAVRVRRRGQRHAGALFWGSVVLALAALHDVALSWGVLPGWSGTSIVIQYGALAFVISVALTTAARFADTETTALRDHLTGLYRREVVMDALTREIRRAARARQPISVVMLDIDLFKAVNDTLGHQGGDRVLGEVGRRLFEAGRAVDWLGRYGGEEFIAVLSATGRDGAVLAADRFRTAVSALPIPVGRISRAITLSAGVACYEGGEQWPTPEQLVGAADAGLYRAKASGRNRSSQ